MAELSEFKAGDHWKDTGGDIHTIVGVYKDRIVTDYGYERTGAFEDFDVSLFVEKMKPRQVRYVNIYADDDVQRYGANATRKEADRKGGDRIACLRVEFEEGQFDD